MKHRPWIGVTLAPGFLADAEIHARENPLLWQLRSDVELERDGYRERGWLRLVTDRDAEAVVEFRRGLEIEPLDPELNYGLSQALQYTGDLPGAIAALELATRWSSFPAAEDRLRRLRSRAAAPPPAAPR